MKKRKFAKTETFPFSLSETDRISFIIKTCKFLNY